MSQPSKAPRVGTVATSCQPEAVLKSTASPMLTVSGSYGACPQYSVFGAGFTLWSVPLSSRRALELVVTHAAPTQGLHALPSSVATVTLTRWPYMQCGATLQAR